MVRYTSLTCWQPLYPVVSSRVNLSFRYRWSVTVGHDKSDVFAGVQQHFLLRSVQCFIQREAKSGYFSREREWTCRTLKIYQKRFRCHLSSALKSQVTVYIILLSFQSLIPQLLSLSHITTYKVGNTCGWSILKWGWGGGVKKFWPTYPNSEFQLMVTVTVPSAPPTPKFWILGNSNPSFEIPHPHF